MKILIVDMSEMLGNINERSIVFGIVMFGTIFLVLFGDCGRLFFDAKVLKILY